MKCLQSCKILFVCQNLYQMPIEICIREREKDNPLPPKDVCCFTGVVLYTQSLLQWLLVVLSSEDWMIIYVSLVILFLFFSLEILGSKGTPYSGGSFKLEIQLPERLVQTVIYMHTISIVDVCHSMTFFPMS